MSEGCGIGGRCNSEAIRIRRIREKWENDDYICRGHILNGMSDSLFNVYTNVKSAKELLDLLESKYMEEDSSSKKFLKDFKHTLKHGKDDLSLVQLDNHLRIEESLRAHDSDKGKGKEVGGPSVNMTEEVPTRNQSWKVGNVERLVTSKGIAIVVKRTTQMLVVRERGLRTIPKTKVDAIMWFINSGATTHVCKDRCWFKTFKPVEDGSVLYMGDEHFAPIHGKGSDLVIITMALFMKLRSLQPQQNGLWLKGKNRALKEMVNSMAVVRLPEPKRKTLGEKGIDCIFVGYAEHSKAYRFYVIEPNDSVSINSIIESRDAIFDENRFSSIPRPKDIIPNVQESQMGLSSMYQMDSRASKRLQMIFKRKICRISTIRGLLALAAIHNLVIHQMDVKTAFLNGDLDEEVYMKQPEGFVMLYSMDPVEKLKPNTGKPVDQLEYSKAIGCLMYAMTSTRPDIAYAVGRLMFSRLSDASWINHVEDSSSTSGWVFLLGGGAISWASKKQTCITSSNMESEFVALAAAVIGSHVSSSRGEGSKGNSGLNMKFSPLQELGT
ncbi:zinc finger, CCHC-type containing protein [Tanacetum coccineum]